MPGRKAKTNKFLLLITLSMSLVCGSVFTQSSATPSPMEDLKDADVIISLIPGASTELTTGDSIQTDSQTPTPTPTVAVTATPTPVPQATATPVPTVVPFNPEASPEASIGVWTPSGSKWMFMVNGSPYTGWLSDTDGKVYYLGSDGIMQTGWLDLDGNRYYLDLDGILQTGDVTIDGTDYHFNQKGVLDGEDIIPEVTPAENPQVTAVPEATVTPAPTDKPEATPQPGETAEPTITPEPTKAAEVQPDTTVTPEATPTPEPTATPTPTPEITPVPDKSIAITFNDGPSDYTGQIMDLLAETDSRATFFLQGSHVEGRQDTLSRMVELGNELGNHAYTHFDLSELNYTDSSAEVAGVDELVGSYIGQSTTVMRPPHGNMNSELASSIRKPVILWSVDSQDESLTDPQAIVDVILAAAEDGAIVKMHDTSELSLNALKLLIPALQREGYRLVTVSELADANGIELVSGTSYSDLKKQ